MLMTLTTFAEVYEALVVHLFYASIGSMEEGYYCCWLLAVANNVGFNHSFALIQRTVATL